MLSDIGCLVKTHYASKCASFEYSLFLKLLDISYIVARILFCEFVQVCKAY